MPTYNYECLKCGHDFEQFHGMMDDSVKNCPECNGVVKRLIGTGSGVIFKGSGFYQTDYKDAGSKQCGESDSCSGCPQKGSEN